MKFIKSLLKDLVQDIFNEGWAQVKRETHNRIAKIEEDLDRVEKNTDRRYHELRRVDQIIKKLDK